MPLPYPPQIAVGRLRPLKSSRWCYTLALRTVSLVRGGMHTLSSVYLVRHVIFGPFFDPSPEVGPGGGGHNGSARCAGTGSSLPWGVGEAVVRWVGFFQLHHPMPSATSIEHSGPLEVAYWPDARCIR